MSGETYDVTITVKVSDEAKVLEAGIAAAKAEGLDDEDFEDFDVAEALKWLVVPDQTPPGTSIEYFNVSKLHDACKIGE